MVILNKIYTKTGDDGTTGLGDGSRTRKFDLRVEAFGSVDEANSVIGLARLYSQGSKLDACLIRIQNDLFDVGADLCVPQSSGAVANVDETNPPLRIQASQVTWLETSIDHYNAELDTLRSFILPGGTKFAAHLHHARTVVRRAERLIVELAASETSHINPALTHYMNRLSDFMFVAARYANDLGREDILWVPGKNREGD